MYYICIIVAVFISLAVSDDFNAPDLFMISQRTYNKYNILTLKSLNVYRPYEVDYRTCSHYVREKFQANDMIIMFGPPVTRYVYTEQPGYSIMRREKPLSINLHTGTVYLFSLENMFEVMEGWRGKRVWILGDHCPSTPQWYTADMCDYLRSLEPHAVCRGEDGRAAAYLLERSE